MNPNRLLLLLALAALPVSYAFAGGGAHGDPSAHYALVLAAVLAVAKLGGEAAVRLGQPAVLGELLAGVLLGNLRHAGVTLFEPVKTDPFVAVVAGLGVLLLLFEVGLESTVKEMMSVGLPALVVAVLGVVAPIGLGWGVGVLLLPDASTYLHLFLGATLCATSVGITARVLKDLEWSRRIESRIILGAAVIDDVLGLVVLSVTTGFVVAAGTGTAPSAGAVGWIALKSFLFLGGAIVAGSFLAPGFMKAASRLRSRGVLLTAGMAICFGFSWAADAVGLAAIVGAFAAGLILEESQYERFIERGERSLEDLVHPLSLFLVPVFFVLMGLHTDLAAFGDPRVLGLAGALTVAAVIGKQACSLGVWTKGIDRLTVGLGMIPRGEVGLIFANAGLTLTLGGAPLISPAVYSALVVMVVVTTLLTPPALAWRINRLKARS
ncbi:MAG: cation:proton antiporter [Acidobacteria bacterium]|nr:cation:proton antiporter [Acidobacteriota bacterium]